MPSFSSTNRYVASIAGLTGEKAAKDSVARWLKTKMSFIDDEAFADRFRSHFDKFAVRPGEFTHRIFQAGDASVLGGIRFYGGASDDAFVDIFAWDEGLSFKTLAKAVRHEWKSFEPKRLRLIKTSDMEVPGASLDQSAHARRVDMMNPPDSDVTLVALSDIDVALELVSEKYAALTNANPALGREIFPASRSELVACKEKGTLHAILFEGATAGLLATLPGEVEFISGHVVIEELISTKYNGHGLAARAQCALAAHLAQERPHHLIAGTIQAINHASRISAQRAGRQQIFEYVFVDLLPRP